MSTLYVDTPPPKYTDTIKKQIRRLPNGAKAYTRNMFPILDWLPKYNLIWLTGDLISAVTVGTLIIPQAFAYAKIANLPPYYGLYTVFIGVLAYPLFGTSKDVSVGTSAILSLMVGQVVNRVVTMPQFISGEWTYSDIATSLCLITGFICTFIGLFRFGFLFHFICQPAVAGFMAGSGVTIVVNQFNKIFGVPNINTSEPTYLVFGKTLINLHHSHYDAIFGVTTLIWLYTVRYFSQKMMVKYPQHKRSIFFFNNCRSIIALVISTVIAYMINHFGHLSTNPFNVLGAIPSGFGHTAIPQIKKPLVEALLPDVPSLVVLMIMEHGAIASSLGKLADYRVNMSQESFTIGIANIFGSFICAYPGTGTFSRSAVVSKSGARTPLSSFFVGCIVGLSIYVFTPAFEYIPYATLSAIIAHSVTDLISGPSTWKKMWDLNPSELLIYACAYIVSLFARIDISVYVPVALSIVIQLYRTSRPKYAVLGCVALDTETYPANVKQLSTKSSEHSADEPLKSVFFSSFDHEVLGKYAKPIDSDIICFQPQENIVFQNCSFIFDRLIDEVKSNTRRGKPLAEKVGDRTWNENSYDGKSSEKPLLNSIILDLSGVHQMDFSGLEELLAASVAIERYSGQAFKWYVVTGDSMAVRKALLFGGFGNQRCHPSRSGMFISDLKLDNKKEGHLPGSNGCSTNIEEYYMTDMDKEDYQHVIVIEDVNDTSRSTEHISYDEKARKSEPKNRKNINTSELSGDTNSVSTEVLPKLCHCNLQQTPPEDGRITSIKDQYPYFFSSLRDAANAALMNKRKEELYINYISNISNISEKVKNTSEDDIV